MKRYQVVVILCVVALLMAQNPVQRGTYNVTTTPMVLTQVGDGVNVVSTSFQQVDLATTVTGVLPVANGGTGTSSVLTQHSVPVIGASGIWSAVSGFTFGGAAGGGLNVPSVAATGTNAYGLQVAAPTGATANYAATFMGGNVGIGTTSPGSKLEVNGGGNNVNIGILSGVSNKAAWLSTGRTAIETYIGTEGSNGGIIVGAVPGDTVIRGNAGNILFSSNGGTNGQLVILNNGNVGIGTTGAGALLDVAKSSTATGLFTARFYDQTATTGATRVQVREGAGQGTAEVWAVYANNGTTKRLDVTNNIVTSTSPFVAAAGASLSGTGNLSFTGGKGQHFNTQAAASDTSGTVTVTNPATTGAVSFTTAYANAPACTLTPTSDQLTTVLNYWVTTSTSAVTANVTVTPTVAITFMYHCVGNPN